MKVISAIFAVTLIFWGYGQTVTSNFSPSQDAYVASGGSASSNFGTASTLNVYAHISFQNTIYRSLIEFDVSSIPSNAIITSAELSLNATTVANGQSHPFYIQELGSSWSEGTVTWNNQPTGNNSTQISIPHSSTSSTGWQTFDVTSHVQRMVNYSNENHGWLIRLQSEGGSTSNGVIYHSDEAQVQGVKPDLEVTYVMPIEISGNVFHEESGSDGSIEISVTEGSETYTSYRWMRLSSGSLSTIEQGTNIANADIDGLDAGVYIFYVEDDEGVSAYKYFLVGEYGATTSVSIYFNSANDAAAYWDDALMVYYNSTGLGNTNFGDYQYSYATDWSTHHGAVVNKFNLDFDPILTFNSADFYFYSPTSQYHTKPSGCDNSAQFKLITEDWQEGVVTWDTRPTTSTSVTASISATTSANQYRDDVIDILDFVEYWQDNPTLNFGFDFSLNSYSNPSNTRLIYASSDNSSSSDRPRFNLEFTVKPKVETSFDDSEYLGDITINAVAGELPYNYLISRNPLPILDSIWNDLDSLGVDSLEFWNGNTNSRVYTFTNIPSGIYFIGVYDNSGLQIMHTEAELYTNSMIYSSTGLSLLTDTLILDTTNYNDTAWAALKNDIYYNEEGGIAFKVLDLSGSFEAGFNDLSQDYTTFFEDFEYGVRVTSSQGAGNLEVVKSNIIAATYSINVGDEIKILKRNSVIEFYRNDTIIDKDTIEKPDYTDFGVETRITGLTAMSAELKPFELAKPRRSKYVVGHASCGAPLGGSLRFYATNFYGSSLTSVTITNTSTLDEYTVSVPGTISGLPAGEYSIESSWTGISGPYSEGLIYIGYDMLWEDASILSPFGNTVTYPYSYPPFAVAPLGKIQSKNISTAGESTWAIYEQKNWGDNSVGIFALQNTSGQNVVNVHLRRFYSDGYYLLYIKDQSGNIQNIMSVPAGMYGYTVGGVSSGGIRFPVTHVPKIKIIENTGEIEVYLNGIEICNITTSSDDFIVYLKGENSLMFKDVVVSFCGEDNVLNYADLTKKLDGGYYKAFAGKVKFIYNEEYNDQDGQLSYNIYDVNNAIVFAGTGDELVAYGDNRYELDFSCDGAAGLVDGVYVLEVINEKNEKWYLRFKIIENC